MALLYRLSKCSQENFRSGHRKCLINEEGIARSDKEMLSRWRSKRRAFLSVDEKALFYSYVLNTNRSIRSRYTAQEPREF